MKLISAYITLLFNLFILILTSYSQENRESPWISVENNKHLNLRIDISTLKSSNESDIFVWVLEKHNKPIQIESIEQNIYKTKTYYLLNKVKMKYSILEIMYYDSTNNVLKDFIYSKKVDLISYKYNYPILVNTPMEAILQTSIKQLAKNHEKIQ